MAVENASFEIAATTGTPGDAADWTWASVQAAIDWAEFNTSTAHVAYQRAREDFAAGFKVPWSFDYADSTARLAATGFVAADVGTFAIQRSDDTMWVLTGYSPITWSGAESGWCQAWVAELLATMIGAAEFSGAESELTIMVEQWNTCTEDYDGGGVIDYDGPGWLYTEIDLKRQDNAVFQGLGAAYTGWTGWFDEAWASAEYPLELESWSEEWGTSPLDSGARWVSGTAPGGRLRGQAISFPLVVSPSKNILQFYNVAGVYEVTVPSGTYQTSTALALAIQTEWATVFPASILEWNAWTDGTDEGLQLQWDAVSTGTEFVLFGISDSLTSNDGRETLGLDSFGPGGGRTDVRYPAAELSVTPTGTTAADTFLLDGWSEIQITLEQDARLGFWHPVEYFQTAAEFDSGVLTVSVLDTFRVWHGGDIIWKTSYTAPDLTQASFTGGLGGTIESFETPATYWPDHIYV